MGKKSSVIVLEQQLIKSKAWLSMNGPAVFVYLIFRCRCQIGKARGKPGKREKIILNNGEIIFTYDEAQNEYGITRPRFVRALDELIAKGFIDIAEIGGGVNKATTKYAISDRWRNYGTGKFEPASRPKLGRPNPGFKRAKGEKKLRKEFYK